MPLIEGRPAGAPPPAYAETLLPKFYMNWAPLRALGLRRTFLHAFSLRLPAMGEFPALVIESPLPEELEAFLQKLK